MKQRKHFILQLIVLAALVFMIAGCHDSSSKVAETEVVDGASLGVYTKEAPAELTQCAYRTSAAQSSYATFSLAEPSTIGYMISDGSLEIYDPAGNMVFSDIFFPVDNSYKTVSLDSGAYLIKIQNSINEDSSFTIFSEEMGLDCTTLRSSKSILIPVQSHQFIAIEVQQNPTSFKATFPTGSVTLFDSNFAGIASESNLINTTLPAGKYILLVDNSDSQTNAILEVVMQ